MKRGSLHPDLPEGGRDTRSSTSLSAIYRVVGVDFTVFGIVYPILPLYAHAIGLSVPAIGALLACYSLFQLLLAPTWGHIADRFGRQPVLLAALGGTFASTVLIALAHRSVLLFIALALNGASGGSMVVAQAAVVDVTESEHRGGAMGRVGAGIAIGFVIGPALAALSGLGGLRLPFVVASVLAGFNLIAAYRVFRRRLVSHATPSPALVKPLCHPDERFEALRIVSHFDGFLPPSGWRAEPSGRSRRRSRSSVAITSGLAKQELDFARVTRVVMAAAQASGVARSTKFFGKRTTGLIGGMLFAVGILGIDVSHSYVVLAVSLVFAGAGYGLLSPMLTAAVANANPSRRTGAAMGLQQAVGCLARVIGPLLAGAVYAGAGSALIGVLGAVAVLGAILLISQKDVVSLVDRTSVRPASLELGN